MILPRRIKAKLSFRGPVDLEAIVPTFNRWIRERRLDDHLLIDIADYRHVPGGPGIILIGHEADIVIDLGEGRPGLAYVRKRSWPAVDAAGGDALRVRVEAVLGWLARVARALDLPVDDEEVRVWIQDRLYLRQPNRGPELAAAVEAGLAGLPGLRGVDVEALAADARRALGVSARVRGSGLLAAAIPS